MASSGLWSPLMLGEAKPSTATGSNEARGTGLPMSGNGIPSVKGERALLGPLLLSPRRLRRSPVCRSKPRKERGAPPQLKEEGVSLYADRERSRVAHRSLPKLIFRCEYSGLAFMPSMALI